MKGKKITKRIGKWRIGDYFRQFSIVVAGIIVTFCGSDLIAEHARQKEVTAVMQFVKAELEHNKEELQNIQNRITKEQQMSYYLTDCDFNVRQIPVDTLQKYILFVSSNSSFEYTSDALEVLKNSSLMQQIKDKKLLLDLVKTYDALQRVQKTVSDFYNIKNDLLNKMSLSFSMNERKTQINGTIYEVYEMALKETTGMRNFSWIARGYFDDDLFPNTHQLLDDNIKSISRKYPSND